MMADCPKSYVNGLISATSQRSHQNEEDINIFNKPSAILFSICG